MGKKYDARKMTELCDTIRYVVEKYASHAEMLENEYENSATVYYTEEGAYVIVDDVTHEVVQISDKNDSNWLPDSTIDNPYIPGGN